MKLTPSLAGLAVVAGAGLVGVAGAPTSSIPVPSSSSATSSASVSTAVPSPSSSPGTTLKQYPAPLNQSWCPSPIYCAGELLQTVQLAGLYEDSKTFVDKPTTKPEEEVVANFNALISGGNATVEALVNFVEENFSGEGLDIEPANLTDWTEQPDFLSKVKEPALQGWLKQVHSYWKDLARQNIQNQTCPECTSSLIPLNNTFIVPGGRFREAYYWDTYWVIIGLLTGGLQETTKGILRNFMDLIDQYGWIPNGGRVYYLNRSQPPLFTQMLYLYVTSTNDTSFLEEAVSINDRELLWWDTNRAIEVAGHSGMTHMTHRYFVTSSAPRPESYAEDWETVNGPLDDPTLNLNISLYSDLASGAESGMDYSGARWTKEPLADTEDTTAGLRTLNTNEQIPVDLESILYRDYRLIARMYDMLGNETRKAYWNDRAEKSKAAVIDLHWDKEAMAFRDYNMTSGQLADIWSTAGYYPYWSEIIPDEVLQSEANAQKAFSGLGYITAHYNGSIPTTLIQTGQQWDFPNVWPPQAWIAVKALQALPSNVSSAAFGNFSRSVTEFSYLPENHFGLTQDRLPEQPILGNSVSNITNVTSLVELGNVGNLTNSMGWRDALVDAMVNRYMGSAFCSWYSTGGSVPGVLERLSAQDLAVTNSQDNRGAMFEKFSTLDLDQAGAGGEYTIQAGFGWTNGVAVVWGRDFGDRLAAPNCPAIESESSASGAQSMHRALDLRPNLQAKVGKYVEAAERR